MKLMAYTFVRTSELIEESWAEFDLDNARWIVPPARMKMDTPHMVPLSRQSVEVLRAFKFLTSNGRLVFPEPSTTAARNCPIRQIVDHQTFFLDLLPGERRKICRDGIRLFNTHYWSNLLSPLAGRLSAPVIIKFDPRDLSSIYYRDEGGRYWTMPYRDLGAPPISLWEHHAAESVLRDRGKHTFNENDLFSAVLQQRKLIGASSRTRRMRDAGLKRKGEPPKRSETHGIEAEDDLEHTELLPFKVEELN